MRVELLKHLSVRQVHAGASLFVRVLSDWSGAGCALRSGSIIQGKVVLATLRAKHSKPSELALSFNSAQCSGMEMTPFPFLLAAVSAPADDEGSVPVIRNMGNPRGVPSNGAVSSLAQLSTQMQLANQPKAASSTRIPALGEVSGIRGLKLGVATGPERSSVLSDKDHDVALQAHTQLILVPASIAFEAQPATSSGLPASGSSGTSAALESSAISPDLSGVSEASANFTTCAPPSCSIDLPSSGTKSASHAALLSIPIRPLGYAPRPNAAIVGLDDDQSIVWLGNDRVLIAFNPHRLIHREGITTADAPLRTIHAVLIDIARSRVISTLDWELSDSGKFLWQLPGGGALVHAGHELRIYDSQLHLTSHLLLPGALSFVRISPSGEFISLGVLRERHTPVLHAKLQADLGHRPSEDVDLLVVDKDFKTIAHSTTTSDIVPPTLLNEGQVMLLAQPDHHYRLQLLDWQGRTSTLARFRSACIPELGTTAPDLLSVSSCQISNGTPEFRVMRPDGRLALKAIADPGELGQEVAGETSGASFAMRFLLTPPSVRFGFPFHGADLLNEEVRIFRASDGKRLASYRAEAPAPSHGGFALSPDGTRLAVMADAHLTIYSVPPN